jgi:hypothetical protein
MINGMMALPGAPKSDQIRSIRTSKNMFKYVQVYLEAKVGAIRHYHFWFRWAMIETMYKKTCSELQVMHHVLWILSGGLAKTSAVRNRLDSIAEGISQVSVLKLKRYCQRGKGRVVLLVLAHSLSDGVPYLWFLLADGLRLFFCMFKGLYSCLSIWTMYCDSITWKWRQNRQFFQCC